MHGSLSHSQGKTSSGGRWKANDATKKLRLFDFFGRAFSTTSETSRAAQGDGGSFEDRNPVYGEGSHSDQGGALNLSIFLPLYLYLLSVCLFLRPFSLSPSVYLSFQLFVDASIYMSFVLLI